MTAGQERALWLRYEACKKQLRGKELTPKEYDRIIKKITRYLNI